MNRPLSRSTAALLLLSAFASPLTASDAKPATAVAFADAHTFRGTLPLASESEVPWALSILDGRLSSPVALQLIEDQPGQMHFTAEAFDATVTVRREARGYTEVRVAIRNKSDQELWLEPRLSLDFMGKDFEWYDGYQSRKVFSRREKLTGSLPFASVHRNGFGIALGLDPRQLVSHFRSALRKSDRVDAELEFSSRMVIAPKEEGERRFVAYGYQPDYGSMNAVQRYWEFFPENYQVHQGVSPDIKGTVFGNIVWMNQHFQYHDGPQGKFNDKVSEVVRWIGGGWEWCYAGYGTRPGDWLCTEETSFDWKVNPDDPKSPEKTTKLRDVFKRSAAQHLEGLMGNYRRLEQHGVSAFMYIIPSYCESELAEKQYADSIYRDAQNNVRSSGPPWVGRYDKSHQMYSYGNSFGDYTLQAIRTIAERTPGLRGFSFDCIDRSNYDYYGTGVERSPGKSYDRDRGVYVNTEIAHAKFGEAVHAIEKDGYQLGLAGNFRAASGSYLAAQAMDASIIEHTPWDERPLPGMVRLHSGTKSVTFLHGYERVPKVDDLSAEELLQTSRMLQDFSILQSLRYGIYPAWKSALGSPKMIYYFSIFNDLYRNYGWQPTPGAHAEGELWISRYGSAPGSILSVGNATEEEISSTLEIRPQYFGGASAAFVDYEGKNAVATRLENSQLKIDGKFPAATASLYAAALVWEQPLEARISARRSVGPGRPSIDSFEVTPTATGKETLVAFAPTRPGYRVTTVRVGGRKVDHEIVEGGVRFTHPQAALSIEIEQTPEIGVTGSENLSQLALLSDAKEPLFQVVLLNNTPSTRREAMKIASFFSGYRYGLDNVDTTVKFEVLSDPTKAAPSRPTIYIGSGTSRENTPFAATQLQFIDGEVISTGNAIGLFAQDDTNLTATGNLLLKLLTPKYPHYGRFHISSKSIPGGAGIFSPSLFQKVTGMDYLPWEEEPSSVERPVASK